MDRPTGGSRRAGRSAETPLPLPAAPCQRWRVVFSRAASSGRPHREMAEAWTAALETCGLPLPRAEGRPRPRLAFATPLPAAVAAERELADLWLARRLPIREVREALTGTMPADLALIDLYDVWLGAPALPAALVAADYRVVLDDGAATADELTAAAGALLAAPRLERDRVRAGGTVRYDLRPLLAGIDVAPPAGEAGRTLRIRTRFNPERGAGRPEEVIAALGDVLGRPLEARATVRERLILDGEEPGEAVRTGRADPTSRPGRAGPAG